jgi:DNA-binding response OmpR family regulator
MGFKRNITAEQWAVKTVEIFSPTHRSLGFDLSDVLGQRTWKVKETTSSFKKAFAEITIGSASVLVIDDSDQQPATTLLRHQIFDLISSITPTIILSSPQHKEELPFMSRIGMPEVVQKPLSPATFLAAFDQLIHRWSTPIMSDLRNVGRQLINKQRKTAFQGLLHLYKQQETTSLTVPTLALIYRLAGKNDVAERLLTSHLDKYPEHVCAMLHLIDIYLFGGEPLKALELIKVLDTVYHRPKSLRVDLIQAHLMLNELIPTIEELRELGKIEFYSAQTKLFIPRILYSAGLHDEFDAAINFRVNKFDEYQKSWHQISDEFADKRKKQYEKYSVAKKQQLSELRKEEQREKEQAQHARPKSQHVADKYVPPDEPLFKKIGA